MGAYKYIDSSLYLRPQQIIPATIGILSTGEPRESVLTKLSRQGRDFPLFFQNTFTCPCMGRCAPDTVVPASIKRFTDMPGLSVWRDLFIDAVRHLGWEFERDRDDRCVSLAGTAFYETHSLTALTTLAPWAPDGSYVELSDDDVESYRLVFNKGEWTTMYPQIVWPYQDFMDVGTSSVNREVEEIKKVAPAWFHVRPGFQFLYCGDPSMIVGLGQCDQSTDTEDQASTDQPVVVMATMAEGLWYLMQLRPEMFEEIEAYP